MGVSYLPSDEENADEGIVAEINVTPLTDVFLVLLIIFMVTTSVAANQSKKCILATKHNICSLADEGHDPVLGHDHLDIYDESLFTVRDATLAFDVLM